MGFLDSPFEGRVGRSFSGVGSYFLNVFTGNTLGTLALYSQNRSSFHAAAGTEYHFQVSGARSAVTLRIQLSALDAPGNDHFENAEWLYGRDFRTGPVSINTATSQSGESDHQPTVPTKSLWWKWQAVQNGRANINLTHLSTATNAVLSMYEGDSLSNLRLIASTSPMSSAQHIRAGEVYYFAASVPVDAIGDVEAAVVLSGDPNSHPIAGNLIKDFSWEEGVPPESSDWVEEGRTVAYRDPPGGAFRHADGRASLTFLEPQARVCQEIPTIPGRRYQLRFAHNHPGTLEDARLRVNWGDELVGEFIIANSLQGTWFWVTTNLVANSTSTRVSFEGLSSRAQLDAVSVLDLEAAPFIEKAPKPVRTLSAGSATFTVAAGGTPRLGYQWLFNGEPIPGMRDDVLLLQNVGISNAGEYSVRVTNINGVVTSSSARLHVEHSSNASILLQPQGDRVIRGSYFSFSVLATGTPPLDYQWYRDNTALGHGTNRSLVISNVNTNDSGVYRVRVSDQNSATWSLPAKLAVISPTNTDGGAMFLFENSDLGNVLTKGGLVFDVDGRTKLASTNFVAQLYAGRTISELRPVGTPRRFWGPGRFYSLTITLPNVLPGEQALVQFRVWDMTVASSYEEARLMGAKHGKSELFEADFLDVPGYEPFFRDLPNVTLKAGTDYFTPGQISFHGRTGDELRWALQGLEDALYVIEKLDISGSQRIWTPFTVLTNSSGTTVFSDPAASENDTSLYRARLLD